MLRSLLPEIRSLRDVSISDFSKYKSILPDFVLRCCRHVITENARTLKAADALETGDITEMGALMSASHQSLRDDYLVSCPELDLLVNSAESQPGVLGARMTGGGFGGCTVSMVKESAIENFKENVAHQYHVETGLIPDIFVVSASNGASEIPI